MCVAITLGSSLTDLAQTLRSGRCACCLLADASSLDRHGLMLGLEQVRGVARAEASALQQRSLFELEKC